MEQRQITEQNPWWEDKERINEDEKVREAISKVFGRKLIFILKALGSRSNGKTK